MGIFLRNSGSGNFDVYETEERAKKRELEEIEQITAAVRETLQDVTRVIEARIAQGLLARDAEEAEIEAIVERAMSKNPLMIEEIKAIHATLETIRQDLAASRPTPIPWDSVP